MEDNEFEEVTIISHTDQAASILPQRTAERLMKEIRMEVTQKISQTENVKMGSLQHSEASTLLDEISPLLSVVPQNSDIYQLQCVDREQKQVLVASMTSVFQMNLRSACVEQIDIPAEEDDDSSESGGLFTIFNIGPVVLWNQHLYLFKMGLSIEVYDLQFNHVKTVPNQRFHFRRYSGVAFTEDRLYFVSHQGFLVSIDIQGEVHAEEFYYVQDVIIDRKDGTPVIIGSKGEIQYLKDDQIATVSVTEHIHSSKYRLKQMYSDHFLVLAEDTIHGSKMLLVDSINLQQVSVTQIPQQAKYNPHERQISVRLFYPRRGLEFILIACNGTVYLFQLHARQLNQCGSLETNVPNIYTMLHLSGNTWLAAGKNCTMASIEVHFPDALKL